MEQVPSLRRCEELPWHLFHCRRWFALKNTLVDLRTFDIMYNGNLQLRGELFNYWKTLIAGPLYINDDLESKAYQSKIELPQHQMMLDELDSASTLGLSDSQVRKERLRGQIAPFDICDEYNRAVEVWNNGVHPSTSRLEGMIMNISEFMAWFSHKMNALQEPPPFLRKTLNFEMLKDIGVDQKNVFGKLQLVGDGSNNSGSGSGEDGGNADDANNNNGAATPKNSDGAVATTEPANFSPEKYGSGGSGLLQPNFYFFNRWIWVMFPWLALKNAATYSDQMHKEKVRGKQLNSLKKFLDVERDGNKAENLKKQMTQLKKDINVVRKGSLIIEEGDALFGGMSIAAEKGERAKRASFKEHSSEQ